MLRAAPSDSSPREEKEKSQLAPTNRTFDTQASVDISGISALARLSLMSLHYVTIYKTTPSKPGYTRICRICF